MIRVLVVDDEPIARQGVRTLLENEREFEIVGEAGTGTDAVAAIRAHRPDLVFLDVQMPDLDGFGVVAALDPDELPAIVFVTAFDEYALRAFHVNALSYLLKPFDRDRFAEVLRQIRRWFAGGEDAALRRRLIALLEGMRESEAGTGAGASGEARRVGSGCWP